MFCIRCQKEVYDCTCPDINERLAAIGSHPAFALAWCKDCNKHIDRCECKDFGQDRNITIKTGEK